MAEANWPSYAVVQLSDFSIEPYNNIRRTEMEDGFAKQAKKHNKTFTSYSISVVINGLALFNSFNTWVKSIDDGASFFNMKHPLTGVVSEFRIVAGSRKSSPVGSNRIWRVQMKIEVLE